MSDPTEQHVSVPSLKDRLSRIASFGPSSLSLRHVEAVYGRIDPRTERSIAEKPGAVAIIPVRGVIVPREDRFSKYFGEVGSEDTAARVEAAVANRDVKVVIMDVESPGGAVAGVPEAAARIRAARGKKPIIAHADFTMASAAYWLSSAADEIVASPSALVGAVGVISFDADMTAMYEKMGIKFTKHSQPADKGDGYGLWPNSEKHDKREQALIDAYYAQFVKDIQATRSADAAAIAEDWAGVYGAPKAKLLGMIDKVRSMSETVGAYTTLPTTAPLAAFKRKLTLSKHKQ